MSGSYQGLAQALLEEYLAGKTITAMLLGVTYEPGTTEKFLEDVEEHEFDGAGYARETVTSIEVIAEDESGEAAMICDPIEFGPLGAEVNDVGGIVFFVDTGDASTSLLLAYDIEGPFDPPTGLLRYVIDPAGGVVTVQV